MSALCVRFESVLYIAFTVNSTPNITRGKPALAGLLIHMAPKVLRPHKTRHAVHDSLFTFRLHRTKTLALQSNSNDSVASKPATLLAAP
jgi:hypothetical protein